MSLGEIIRNVNWSLQVKDVIRYAWASGDLNPIHFDANAAQELGLPGPIAHGLYAHARLNCELLSAIREHGLGKLAATHTKFSAMMPIPGEYHVVVSAGADSNVLVARVLNAEGATCVEVRAQLR